MFSIRNLKIGTKLWVLIGIGTIGLASFAAYAFYTIGVIRVNGPIYQSLTQDQDLVADILPPPAYIIESYLNNSQILDLAGDQDTEGVEVLVQQAAILQKDYEARHAYWVQELADNPNEKLKQGFLVDSYEAAETYFRLFNETLLPVIRAGKVEEAHEIFHGPMTQAYEEHRAAIYRTVEIQQLAITEHESDAQSQLDRSSLLLILLAVLTSAAVVGLSIIISRSITTPVNLLTQVTSQLASGKLTLRASVETTDEIGQLAKAFNLMATQLQDLVDSLEQRVADRTKALVTSAEVSRRLTLATTSQQLAVDVVEQAQAAFHYYHAHIYFVDEMTGDLVMAGGTGEAGATLLAHGHKVPKGRGLVGRAAETNSPILVPDVSKAEGWLPNPLLPETRSEVAVPIAYGNHVLGVLDVQQNVVNGLRQEDVNLLQSLADQAAISLQNVRSYEESRSQAELETMVNLIGQKIQRAATVEDALQTAIRELGNALGAPRVRGSVENSTSRN